MKTLIENFYSKCLSNTQVANLWYENGHFSLQTTDGNVLQISRANTPWIFVENVS